MLLSSHILAEVEKLCDNVTIIRAGERRPVRHAQRTATSDAHHGHRSHPRRRPSAEPACPTYTTSCSQDGQVWFSVDRTDLDFTMEHLTDPGIVELTVHPASLEDMFLREYQGTN